MFCLAAAVASSQDMSGLIRAKQSANETLPPVGELLASQPRHVHYTDLDGQTQKLDLSTLADTDLWPLPMPLDREGYNSVDTSTVYWGTGLTDWRNVKAAIEKFGAPTTIRRLLDFGCATGRVLRQTLSESDVEGWGCDYAPANIEWMRQHLPPELRTFVNTNIPHLPIADGFFDVVTAFSVFTHIDVFEEAWLLELLRITRPDGLLYLTVHNEATWAAVPGRPSAMENLAATSKKWGNPVINEELFATPMPDRVVLRMSKNDIYNCNVWATTESIVSRWGRFADVLGVFDLAHSSYQSVVVLRPKS